MIKIHKEVKVRKQSRDEILDEEITRLAKLGKLEKWNAFVKEISIPMEFYPALATGRTELLRLAPPRNFTDEEMKQIYDLVATLLETNMALREHASQVAQMVGLWQDTFGGQVNHAMRIERFANFQTVAEQEHIEEEEEDV